MGTSECLQPCDIASGPMVRIGIMKETEKSSRITGAGSFPATPSSFRLMSGPPVATNASSITVDASEAEFWKDSPCP